MATATFSGTYTQNNGEDYATGTVAITPYGGATVTVTLDATGSYSQVVTLVLTSVSGVWVNDAGAIVTSAPASGVQIIPPNGTTDRGKCRVVETITGKPVVTSVFEVADGATVNTGRDVGTVLGGADAIPPGTYAGSPVAGAPMVAAVHQGQRLAGIGDSITIGNSTAGGGTAVKSTGDTDWLSWACLLSGGKFLYTRNAGVPTNSAAQMLARFDTDVSPYTPNIVVINAGTNDANTGVTIATFAANIKALVAKVLAIGARPILSTICPTNTSGAWRQNVELFNIFLKLYAAQRGFPIVDFYSLLIEPTTGGYVAAYTADGIHPTAAAAKLMGQALADALASGSPLWTPPLANHQTADSRNMFANALFLTDTNADGLSDSYSKTANGTASRVTGDTAIKGNWQRLTDTNTAQAFISTSPNLTTGWTAGDRVAIGGRLTVVNGTSTGVSQFNLQFNSGTPNGLKPINAWSQDLANVPVWLEDVVPAATASLGLLLARTASVAGNGYIQLAQLTAYNLTTLGIVAALA